MLTHAHGALITRTNQVNAIVRFETLTCSTERLISLLNPAYIDSFVNSTPALEKLRSAGLHAWTIRTIAYKIRLNPTMTNIIVYFGALAVSVSYLVICVMWTS